jgi:hypothetical protein
MSFPPFLQLSLQSFSRRRIQYSHPVILSPSAEGRRICRGRSGGWILRSSLQAEAFRLKPGNGIWKRLSNFFSVLLRAVGVDKYHFISQLFSHQLFIRSFGQFGRVLALDEDKWPADL